MQVKARARLLGSLIILLSGFGIYKCLHASMVTIRGGTHEFEGLFDYPIWTTSHFISGAVFLALLPFQFWTRFRNHHRRLHRRSGRVLVAAGLILAVSGLVLPNAMPMRPVSEKMFMTIFSLSFVFFLSKAVLAAQRRDFVQHRVWMLRTAAVALGPMVQRIIFPIFPIVLGIHSLPEFWEYFVTSLWLSAVVVMVTAEWWIRSAPAGNSTTDPIGKAL